MTDRELAEVELAKVIREWDWVLDVFPALREAVEHLLPKDERRKGEEIIIDKLSLIR